VFAHTTQGAERGLDRPRAYRAGDGALGHKAEETPDAGLDEDAPPGGGHQRGERARRRKRKQTQQATPSQQDGNGQREPGLSPIIIRAGAGTGEVSSAGTLGGIPFGPAPNKSCVGTSTLGGHRVLGGDDISILQPGARTLSEDPPHHSPVGLGGTVLYIKANLSSNEGVGVTLLNYSGNHVCSS
jgi:hypothetical protein